MMNQGLPNGACRAASAPGEALGVLEIDASITNPFLLMALLYPLNIDINGQRHRGGFKRNVMRLAAGQCHVRVALVSPFGGDSSARTCSVPVHPGHATVLRYGIGFFGIATLTFRGCFVLPPPPQR